MHSRWREEAFIHRQIQAAMMPRWGLAQAIQEWHTIREELAETPRKRPRQRAKLASLTGGNPSVNAYGAKPRDKCIEQKKG